MVEKCKVVCGYLVLKVDALVAFINVEMTNIGIYREMNQKPY